MNIGKSRGPIFVVGSPRSGTSILTWSIGQHPNILALEETGWMGPITMSLAVAHATGAARGERSQLSAMGVTRAALMSAFGGAIDQLILGHRSQFEELAMNSGLHDSRQVSESIRISRSPDEPKSRWIDGTPENSFYIYELSLLFPDARFVHLVRDPRSVARSLIHFHTIGGARYTVDAAYREWLRNVQECHKAERALGSERVLRIRYSDLVERSRETVGAILQFVGEIDSDYCSVALNTRINSSTIPNDAESHGDGSALITEAEALAAVLFNPAMRYEPELDVLAQLEERFNRRSFGRGLSLSQLTLLRHTIPRDAIVLVASGGDAALLNLDGRTGWHFPQGTFGAPGGPQLQSDDELAQDLERLRTTGAEFLLVPAGSGLAARAGFVEHLEQRYTHVAREVGVADVWALAMDGEGPPRPSTDHGAKPAQPPPQEGRA